MNTAPHYTKSESALLVLAMQSAHATGGRTRDDLIQTLRGYIVSRSLMIKMARKGLKPSSIARHPITHRAFEMAKINDRIKGKQADQRRARRVLKKMGAGA